VTGAARIAELIEERWRDWKLLRIRLVAQHATGHPGRPPQYELETAGHRRIVWGSAPDSDVSGEPTAASKLVRLQRLAEAIGDFDAQPAESMWDLRSP